MTSSITPLRISPGVTPDTHPSIATGHSRSKFGLPARATATDRLIERMLTRGSVRLHGIHMHLGSQIRDLRVYETVRTVANYLRAWDLPELCVGGGLAVAYTARETAPSITEFAETVRRAGEDTLPAVRLTCELGRWIVAPAAVTLYAVGTVKALPRRRDDRGGRRSHDRQHAASPLRPEYEVLAPRRPRGPARPVTVVGKHRESGDVLAEGVMLPENLAPGDVVCSLVTGAYGYSMASSYNRLGRPAVVFASGGRATVLRRETPADMIQLDVWPSRREDS